MADVITRDIGQASYSNTTDNVQDVTINTEVTEGADGQKEFTYQWTNWPKWYGIYKTIPEVKVAIDMRSVWTIGKGYETQDNRTKIILDHIKGQGHDTFNSILKNMMTVKRINGDSFAEIIRDEKTKTLLNLKVLDPGTMKVVYNSQGRIIRYEQVSKVKGQAAKKFEPKEIFHLTNKKVADSICGTSDIEAIEEIVNANKESFTDNKELQHRFVRPKFVFKVDTDDPTKIAAFAVKMDTATNLGENIYIPKDTMDFELLAVPHNATLSPMPWREHLKNYFFQVVGIPQIILGSSGEFTESTAKIAYLAFEQSVDDEQNEIEEQIWNQLYLKVKLTFPASLRNELLSDQAKDGSMAQTSIAQPSDIQAGAGR